MADVGAAKLPGEPSSPRQNTIDGGGMSQAALLEKRRLYLPETYELKVDALDSATESCKILVHLLQYLKSALRGTLVVPDQIAFLLGDLRMLFAASDLLLSIPSVSSVISPLLLVCVSSALQHPEPIVQAWSLLLLCSCPSILEFLMTRGSSADFRTIMESLFNIVTGNSLRWNRIHALDVINVALSKSSDIQDADALYRATLHHTMRFFSSNQIFPGDNETNEVASRFIQTLGHLLDRRSKDVMQILDEIAAILYAALHVQLAPLQLSSLQVLIRSLAPVFANTAKMFVERVTELADSPDERVQAAAVQFLGRYLTQAPPKISPKDRLKMTLDVVRSFGKLNANQPRSKLMSSGMSEQMQQEFNYLRSTRHHRNRLVREVLRVPLSFARLYGRPGPSPMSTIFETCETPALQHTTAIKLALPVDNEGALTVVTISRRIPQLPGVPEGATTIPVNVSFDGHTSLLAGIHLDEFVLRTATPLGVPSMFSKSVTNDTEAIPSTMTDEAPPLNPLDPPAGFRLVQIAKGVIDRTWREPPPRPSLELDDVTGLRLAPVVSPPFTDDFTVQPPPRTAIDITDFPLHSEVVVEMDSAFPCEERFIIKQPESATKTSVDPRMYIGKVVARKPIEGTTVDDNSLRAPRSMGKQILINIAVCGGPPTFLWETVSIQITNEVAVWSVESLAAAAEQPRRRSTVAAKRAGGVPPLQIIPAGILRDRKEPMLLFYPPVNVPPMPVAYTAAGVPLYDVPSSPKPLPSGYTSAGVPYFIKPGTPVPVRARLCGYAITGTPIVTTMTSLTPRPSGFTPHGIPYYSASWLLAFLQLCADGLLKTRDVQLDLFPTWDSQEIVAAAAAAVPARKRRTDELFQFSFSSEELLFSSTTKPQTVNVVLDVYQRFDPEGAAADPLPSSADVMFFATPYEIFTCTPNRCTVHIGEPVTISVTFSPLLCEAPSSYISGAVEVIDIAGVRCGSARLNAFCGPWIRVDAQSLTRAWCEVGLSRTVNLIMENVTSKDVFCKLSVARSTEYEIEDDELFLPPFSDDTVRIRFMPREEGMREALLIVTSEEHDAAQFEIFAHGGTQMLFEGQDAGNGLEAIQQPGSAGEPTPPTPAPLEIPATPEEANGLRRSLLQDRKKSSSVASPNGSRRRSLAAKQLQRVRAEATARATSERTRSDGLFGPVALGKSASEAISIEFGVVGRGHVYTKSFNIKNRMKSESIVFADFLYSELFSCTNHWHEVAGRDHVSIEISANIPPDAPTGVVRNDVSLSWPDSCNTHIPVCAFIGSPLEFAISHRAYFPPSAIGAVSSIVVHVRNLSPFRLTWRCQFADVDTDTGFFFVGNRVEDALEAARVDGQNKVIGPHETLPLVLGFIADRIGPTTAHLLVEVDCALDDSFVTAEVGPAGGQVDLVGIGIDLSRMETVQFELLQQWIERCDAAIISSSIGCDIQDRPKWPHSDGFASEHRRMLPGNNYDGIIIDPPVLDVTTSFREEGKLYVGAGSCLVKHQRGVGSINKRAVIIANGVLAKQSAASALHIDVQIPASVGNCVVHGFLCVIDFDTPSFAAIPVTSASDSLMSIHPNASLAFGTCYVALDMVRPVAVFNGSAHSQTWTASIRAPGSSSIIPFRITGPGDKGVIDPFQTVILLVTYNPLSQGQSDAMLDIEMKSASGATSTSSLSITGNCILPLDGAVPPSIDFGSVPTGFQALVEISFSNNSTCVQHVHISAIPPFTALSKCVTVPHHGRASIILIYQPSKSGNHSHFFCVKSGSSLVQIPARAQAGTLSLAFANIKGDMLDFGVQQTGTVTTKYVMLSNLGTLPVQIGEMNGTGKVKSCFRITPVSIVRRTHTIPPSKTVSNPWHRVRALHKDFIRILQLLPPRAKETISSVSPVAKPQWIVPPLQALYIRVQYYASWQGASQTTFPIQYSHAHHRRTHRSNDCVVRYLPSSYTFADMPSVSDVLLACLEETPGKTISFEIHGRGLGKILILTPVLDFEVVPAAKNASSAIPRAQPAASPERRRKSVASKGTGLGAGAGASAAASSNLPANVRLLELVNASFMQQAVTMTGVTSKLFSVQLKSKTLSPGELLSVPVAFQPSATDVPYTASVTIRHNFGEEHVALRGTGGDVRLRFPGGGVLSTMKANLGQEVCDKVVIENRGLLRGLAHISCGHAGPFGLIDPMAAAERNHVRDMSLMINAGESTESVVTFLSSEFEEMAGTLTVTWEPTPGAPTKEISMQLSGKVGVAKLSSKQKKIKIPVALINVISKRELVLVNTGDSTCHWKSRSTDKISIAPSAGEIEPGGSAVTTVLFRSGEVENFTGSIVIRSDGGNLTIPVTASVSVPQLNVNGQMRQDLGVCRVNQVVSHVLELFNSGRSTIVVAVDLDVNASDADTHARLARIARSANVQSDPETPENERSAHAEIFASTSRPLIHDEFTVRDWFLQLEPNQSRRIEITCKPTEMGVTYSLLFSLVSGILLGSEYIPVERSIGNVSCIGGSAQLRLSVNAEDTSAAPPTGLESWTDDTAINAMLSRAPAGSRGPHDSEFPSVSLGLLLVHQSRTQEDALVLTNAGNMMLDYEIADEPGHPDNGPFSAFVFTVIPDGGTLQPGESAALSVRASPSVKGFFQRRLLVTSLSWNIRQPFALSACADDRLLDVDVQSLDFGRRQSGIPHSLPITLSSGGRFSFEYQCIIEVDRSAIDRYNAELEEQRLLQGGNAPPPSTEDNSNAVCPFSLLNAKGSVAARGYSVVEVQFRPTPLNWALIPAFYRVVVRWAGPPFVISIKGLSGTGRLEILPVEDGTPPGVVNLGKMLVGSTRWASVRLSNPGSLPVDFRMQCSGTDASCLRFRLKTALTGVHTVKEGGSMVLDIGIETQRVGAAEALIEIHSDVGAFVIRVLAYGAVFSYEVLGSLDFGDVPMNRKCRQSLTLTNTGELSAEFRFSFSDPSMASMFAFIASDDTASTTMTVVVAESASQTCTFQFLSQAPVTFGGRFVIISPIVDGTSLPSKRVLVSAVACAMSIDINDGSDIDVGFVTVNDVVTVTRRLSNPTNTPLRFHWSLAPLVGSSSTKPPPCWSVTPMSGSIIPNNFVEVAIKFTALESLDETSYNESVLTLTNVAIDSVDATIRLKGALGLPKLEVTLAQGTVTYPNQVHFGRYLVGSTAYCSAEVRNSGRGRLEYAVEFTDQSDSAISIVNSRKQVVEAMANKLGPGCTDNYYVKFSPVQPGQYRATLSIGGRAIQVTGSASTFAIDDSFPRTIDLGVIPLGASVTNATLAFVSACAETNPVRLSWNVPASSRCPFNHVADDAGDDDSTDADLTQMRIEKQDTETLSIIAPVAQALSPPTPEPARPGRKGSLAPTAALRKSSATPVHTPKPSAIPLVGVSPAKFSLSGLGSSVSATISVGTALLPQPTSAFVAVDALKVLCPEFSFNCPFPGNMRPIPGERTLYLSAVGRESVISVQYSISVGSLRLSSWLLELPPTLVGRPTYERFTVSNESELNLPVSIRSPSPMLAVAPSEAQLAPHEEVEVTVTFFSTVPFDTDTALKERNATLDLVCTSIPELFEPATLQVSVCCRDYAFDAALLGPVQFDPVLIGISPVQTRTITLHSVAVATVTCRLRWGQPIADAFASPDTTNPFSIDAAVLAAEMSFEPGESRTIEIQFEPHRASSSYRVPLCLDTVMGTFDMLVSGAAFEPHVILSVQKVDFGVVAVDYPVERIVTLTNPCPLPFLISSPTTNPEFQIIPEKGETPGQPRPLGPRETITLRIRFTPKFKKKQAPWEHCTFLIYHEGWPEPLAQLLCVGKSGQMNLEFSKGTLKLGKVPHKRTQTSKFSMKNTGTVPIHCGIMKRDSTDLTDTIHYETGWIKFKPNEFSLLPGDSVDVEVLVMAAEVGMSTFVFRVGLLDSIRERVWQMQIQLYGDKIILSSQAQAILKSQELECTQFVEIEPNVHLLDVVRPDDRIHTVSIHHELVMVERGLQEDTSIAAMLLRPPAVAPEVIGTLRKWYASRAPLRLTSSTTGSPITATTLADQLSTFESMLSPVDQRRHE